MLVMNNEYMGFRFTKMQMTVRGAGVLKRTQEFVL